MTVSGAAQTAAATDRIYIVYVFDDAAGGGSFQFKSDSTIDTPLSAGGGSSARIQVSSRSDILADSRPSATSNHTIAFTLNNSLVTQSSSVTNTLTLTFPTGFSLANVTCGDVDVATATQFLLNVSGDGAQTNCPNTATSWGMLIDSTNQIITLTTPSSTNQYTYVATGTQMTIKIGSNATSQNQGAHWITNPSSAGVYTISVGGTFGGSGNMLVAIQSAVTVAATVAESLSFTVNGVGGASDNFNRANETLGAPNWQQGNGAGSPSNAIVVSNALGSSGSTAASGLYVGISFGNDQYSQATLTQKPGSFGQSGVGVRLTTNCLTTMYSGLLRHRRRACGLLNFNCPNVLAGQGRRWAAG